MTGNDEPQRQIGERFGNPEILGDVSAVPPGVVHTKVEGPALKEDKVTLGGTPPPQDKRSKLHWIRPWVTNKRLLYLIGTKGCSAALVQYSRPPEYRLLKLANLPKGSVLYLIYVYSVLTEKK